MEIRNIAIIAHVDHGKTTLTDAIMRQTGSAKEGVSMDTDALEQERGITIYAKNTAVFYRGTKINIVDTPGHADFGSEVERVLRSIDNVILVVDAQEGPMPQTRFVLKKSLELGFKPLVVINKIDKPAAQPNIVQEQVFELFLELGATDEQLNFTTIYTIGREGIAKEHLEDTSSNLEPLLNTILSHIPPASADTDKPLRMQAFNLGYDDFLGRLALCRIYDGSVQAGKTYFLKKSNRTVQTGRITKIYTFEGMNKKEIASADAGDIAMVAGFSSIDIGETICETENQEPLPAIVIDEPTISLRFFVNDSPFAGRDGKFVTNKQLRERLKKELEINVGLKVDFSSAEYIIVYGRGELHISILLENMRREGYELQVSKPRAIIKDIDGIKQEPFEEATVDVPEEMAGVVIEKMGKRGGIMKDMRLEGNQNRIIFEIPTRGLLGYREEFMVDTKGRGILCSRFIGFKPYAGEIKKREIGSMISGKTGKALGYALANLQERGDLYINAGAEVYEGQIIGNTSKGEDMTVNPIKGKQLTNMRASGSDEAIQLIPPIKLTLEKALNIISADEYLEITPKNIRLRKKYLKETDRIRAYRKKQD